LGPEPFPRRQAIARPSGRDRHPRADRQRRPLPVVPGLHCFDDPAATLGEAARILKPGGRLVGSGFVRGDDSCRQRHLIRPGAGGFGRIETQPEVEAWLAAAGFQLTSLERSGPMLFFDALS
jgi:SAM-dependent methyltransferase